MVPKNRRVILRQAKSAEAWKNISPKNGKDFPQNGKPLHFFGWLICGLRVSRISNSLKRKAI